MPWTMTLRALVEEDRHLRLLPSLASSAALSAAPSMVSTSVTSGWSASSRIRRPSSTLLPSRRTTSGLLASSPRISSACTMPLATASHAVMPPKTLTKTRLDLVVVQDHVEAVGHHLGRGAAADVEEVRRLHAAVLLTGVRHDVERGHHQPGAVADDADGAVELDVVEALGLGLRLERVGGRLVLERRRGPRAGSRRSRRGSPCRRAPRGGRRRAGTSGLTSTSDASSLMKTSHSFFTTSCASSATSCREARSRRRSRRPSRRRRRPAGRSRPWRCASGFSCATSSISTPPSTLAMQR